MESLRLPQTPEDILGGAAGRSERLQTAYLLDDTRTWIDPNGYRLADRLWRARASDRAQIERILREGIADAVDALLIAERLEALLTPAGRKVTTATPRSGIGNYAARRLARTEVTRAFGQATIQAAARNPFVEKIDWLLSNRHPMPDECDRNAERGPYPLDRVPRYPSHPHCLCALAPVVTKSVNEVVMALRRQFGLGGEN